MTTPAKAGNDHVTKLESGGSGRNEDLAGGQRGQKQRLESYDVSQTGSEVASATT